MAIGSIKHLLDKVYEYKGLVGEFSETKKRIVRIRLSLKTGLSMNKYTDSSQDSSDDLEKIIIALKAPEFGLEDFEFRKFL